ncbi:MAG: Multicopper oxidase type 2 [Verrucomicrobiaceae bacterium]|nr:Multicopper oxidase type 2 [Verrucomicrobiaceae bacterium]
MRHASRSLFATALLCWPGMGGGSAWSQPATAALTATTPTAAPPADIAPTVTARDGDLGGHYFGKVPEPAHTHHYYIAAEPCLWDFAPEVNDAVCGRPLPPAAALNHQTVSKIRYVQYTDATFQAKVAATPRLGILGPVLRGVTGDFLAITFLNRSGQPLSMHPHGVRYDKDSEGSYYPPEPGKGAAVGPGATFTYVWHLDEASAPLPGEPSSKVWLYHSHVMGDNEVNLGLVGCIIVTDAARARPDGTPADVDREMATLYLIFDESGLDADAKEAYEYVNTPGGPPVKTWAQTMELQEAGARYAINGRTFGNLSGLEMNEGERVRWYLLALGSEQDFHTAHWHGMRVIEEGRRRTDVVELMPASMKVADMLADNPGSWLLHCHVAEHMREGMFTRYTVHAKGTNETGREPDTAFLGLNKDSTSLQIKHAEILPDGHFRLSGSVTVFEAFSIFNQPAVLTLGGRAFTFKPDPNGRAMAQGATWQVRNADPFGVVHGGELEFECELPATVIKARDAAQVLKMGLELGKASHGTTVKIAPRKP